MENKTYWVNKSLFPKRGEVWFYASGIRQGSEQRGVRPCVVVSNNKGNENGPTITIVPLTTQEKKCIPTHYYIDIGVVSGTVLCEQVTTISKERLQNHVGEVYTDDLIKIDECLKIQLDINCKQIENNVTQNDTDICKVEWERDLYKKLYEDFILKLTDKLGGTHG